MILKSWFRLLSLFSNVAKEKLEIVSGAASGALRSRLPAGRQGFLLGA